MFNFIRRENPHFWEISKVVLIVLNLLWGFVNETFIQGLFLSSIIVFPRVPLSIQVLAPISTLLPITTPPK